MTAIFNCFFNPQNSSGFVFNQFLGSHYTETCIFEVLFRVLVLRSKDLVVNLYQLLTLFFIFEFAFTHKFVNKVHSVRCISIFEECFCHRSTVRQRVLRLVFVDCVLQKGVVVLGWVQFNLQQSLRKEEVSHFTLGLCFFQSHVSRDNLVVAVGEVDYLLDHPVLSQQ